MTRSLRADPVWQAQVRWDLGGLLAMERWEYRFAKSQLIKKDEGKTAPDTGIDGGMCVQDKPQPEGHDISKDKSVEKLLDKALRKPPRKSSGIKTDRHGLFRLAPISRACAAPPRAVITRLNLLRSVGTVFYAPKPIAVTPDDLRGEERITGGDNMQPPGRLRIIGIWRALTYQLVMWNNGLLLADLAVSIPAFREYIPPP